MLHNGPKEDKSRYTPLRHQTHIPFRESHAVQRLIGDYNFIHIPIITNALNDDDYFKGLSASPGYVISSISVFRTLAAAARHYIQNDLNPLGMKIESANFEFAAPVSFKGEVFEQLYNPSTPAISFISNMLLDTQRCVGYHDAIVGGDKNTNLYAHKNIDNPQDSKAVVAVSLDGLTNGPFETTDECLPKAMDTPYDNGYETFFSAIQQLAITDEDQYSAQALSMVHKAMVPWFLAGKSASIIAQYLIIPNLSGPYEQRFCDLRDKLSLADMHKGKLWSNLSDRLSGDDMTENQYYSLLAALGIPANIQIPKKSFPMYTTLEYNGFSGTDKIVYGGPTQLDLTGLKAAKRDMSCQFTGFVGETYAFQFSSSFKLVPNKAAPRIFEA